jgi:hypothetical protein
MLAWLLTLPDRAAAVLARRPTLWRAVAGVVFAALLAVTVVRYLKKVEKPSEAGTYTRSAFLRWKPQVEALDRGEDIYDRYQYPNPPIMALVLRPFMRLPSPTDAVVWLFFKAALAAVGIVWVFRLVSESGREFPPLAAAAASLLALHPILGDLSHGNVNIFIAFLVFAALELFRRRLDVTAGVVLALAIACKVTPALFLPYFGWKAVWSGWTAVRDREPVIPAVWRGGGAVLAGCVVGLGVWLYAVPGAVLGFDRNQELLASWYGQMVRPFVEQGKVTSEHPNQSIPGVVFRLLTHSESDTVYDDDGKAIPSAYSNLADVGPDRAKWLIRGCQAAFALAVFMLCRAPVTHTRQGLWVAAECALVVLGMLLFSERTWKHHATTLILPMAVLGGCWAMRPMPTGRKAVVFGTLAAAVGLMTLPGLLPEEAQDLCLTYGTHTAAFLLLTAGVCAVMRWERDAAFAATGGGANST